MNICRYINKFGDRSFNRKPFSNVDSLVLSQISYLIFKDVLKDDGDTIAIKDLDSTDIIESLTKDTLEPRNNRILIRELARSKRFQNIHIAYFTRKDDEEKMQQFAALTFLIGRNAAYIAFRGTDISILGWKEDLNLALLSEVPSQLAAKKYLDTVFKHLNDRHLIMVGGHSKGGNLAVYAATNCRPEIQERISVVFDHDGPGFKKRIFSQDNFLNIESKIDRTIPRNSLVGILLNHYHRTTIVKSRAITGLIQHDPFRWQIDDKGHFITCDQRSGNSTALDQAFNDWLEDMSDEERRSMIEKIFRIFDTSKIVDVKQVKREGLVLVRNLIGEFAKDPKEDRIKTRNMARSFVRLYLGKRLDFATYSRKIERIGRLDEAY